jgi:hypothetical protein
VLDPSRKTTVSIPRAGTDPVTDPPDKAAAVEAILLLVLLLIIAAVALAGLKPVKLTLTLWAEVPVFKNTTTTDPSVFLNAVTPVLETVPVVDTRYAPGLTYRDHIANAQRIPLGVTFVPSVSTRCAED